MINGYISVDAPRTAAPHDEPIVAPGALQLASLADARGISMCPVLRAALQLCKKAVLPLGPSTHSRRLKKAYRGVRDDLESDHRSRSLKNVG